MLSGRVIFATLPNVFLKIKDSFKFYHLIVRKRYLIIFWIENEIFFKGGWPFIQIIDSFIWLLQFKLFLLLFYTQQGAQHPIAGKNMQFVSPIHFCSIFYGWDELLQSFFHSFLKEKLLAIFCIKTFINRDFIYVSHSLSHYLSLSLSFRV